MTWIVLSIGSVVLFTSMNILQRVIAVETKNQRAMAVLFNSICALISLIVFVLLCSFRNLSLPKVPEAWIALLVASFFYGMYERGRFTASKLLDASVFTTIGNVAVLIAFTVALFLYSEPLTVQKLLGGILIMGALILVSLNKTTSKASKKGIFLAILISIAIGLGWGLDKLGAQFFTAQTYSIFVWTIPLFFIWFPSVKTNAIKIELKNASWRVFLLAGINVVAYLMQLKALETAEATRVIPILQTSTIFTVLIGIIILKERDHIFKKIIAGILAVVGCYFLV